MGLFKRKKKNKCNWCNGKLGHDPQIVNIKNNKLFAGKYTICLNCLNAVRDGHWDELSKKIAKAAREKDE